MRKFSICSFSVFLALLVACKGNPYETFTTAPNGDYKVVIRTQGFHSSGTVNVDVCVTDAVAPRFPENNIQCLLHGYDFSGLAVHWTSPQEIAISFDSGRATKVSNYAIVTPKSTLPVQFHATLHEAGSYISR